MEKRIDMITLPPEKKYIKYIITYNGKQVVRRAYSAENAIDRLCNQYGWRCRLDMYDADTRGMEWAKCSAATDGGINYDITLIAEIDE